MQSNAWAKDEPNEWSKEAERQEEVEFKKEMEENPPPPNPMAPEPPPAQRAPRTPVSAQAASQGTPWMKYALWGGAAVGAWWLYRNWEED
jgi:hypothetical protein